MMNLSLAQVKKFGSEIQSLKTKHEKAIQKADDVIEQGVEATLASATAFGLGIWQTRADHQKLLGVPVDLAVGLAALDDEAVLRQRGQCLALVAGHGVVEVADPVQHVHHLSRDDELSVGERVHQEHFIAVGQWHLNVEH